MHRLPGVLVAIVIASACGGGSESPIDAAPPDVYIPPAPALRNPVDMSDEELATRALQLLGAGVAGAKASSCNECHGMTKARLQYWRTLSEDSLSSCLTDLSVSSQESARTMIDCLRMLPTVPTSDFSAVKLGIYASATRLPWFDYLFWRAYGDEEGPVKLAELQADAAMPKEGVEPFTQGEFDIVAEWYARGLPKLDDAFQPEQPSGECIQYVTNDVAQHVAEMATSGWRTVNAENMMAMYGCGSATNPRECLTDKPLAVEQPYGTQWEIAGRGRIRVLKEVTYTSSFWTRSSPDGRFVGHGVANMPGSAIIDLQRDAIVTINASYDPAFFPDNAGFMFQGGPRNTCAISVLTSNPSSISMNEPGCTKISQVGLYQHVGRFLGGGDYVAIDNSYTSDDGGKSLTRSDPRTSFTQNANTSFTPMVFDGTAFQPRASVDISTPFEGDVVLAHSGRLTMSRLAGPNDRQVGYVLRKVNATFNGTNYQITAPEVARYCVTGGKGGFSYDERWYVYHHYIGDDDAVELGFSGPADPGFAEYRTRGAANLYLLDLATGTTRRITNMQPGQYALFPHFRSDGWIYAQVRQTSAGREYTIATDAALALE
jgi:hypothetical protein